VRSRCFLKDADALQARQLTHQFAVSGERLCRSFGEGLLPSVAQQRKGLSSIIWRTAWSQASEPGIGYDLLQQAGRSGWDMEAARTFASLGFVAIVDALSAPQVANLRHEAETIASTMLSLDPRRTGNRGPRRYSYGGASHTLHTLHLPAWTQLIDNQPASTVMKAIHPEGYFIAGGGGDFVLGATSTFQSLHRDLGPSVPSGADGSPPAITINFLLEDLTCADAPLRVVPGSHESRADPPALFNEPQEAKYTILCPLPAGSAIVRDLRAWHGGTPNGSDRTRYMLSAEFVSASLGRSTCGSGWMLDPCRPQLSRSQYESLSVHGKAIASGIVDSSGELEQAAASGSWLRADFADFTRHRAEAY